MTQSAFVTTHWTRVLQARGDSAEARAALSDLCAAYYSPVFAFIRSRSKDEDIARDLTQEFFRRLLSGKGISSIDPQYGRFRSFLLGAVKHFLADIRDHSLRLKRGGGECVLSLESITQPGDTEVEVQLADPHTLSPDREFDRKWALTLLDRALVMLACENKEPGRAVQFEAIKPWLTGDSEQFSQAEVSARLGLSDGALRVAIHRLRQRFREIIKNEISQTLTDPSQLAEEMTHLLAALG